MVSYLRKQKLSYLALMDADIFFIFRSSFFK